MTTKFDRQIELAIGIQCAIRKSRDDLRAHILYVLPPGTKLKVMMPNDGWITVEVLGADKCGQYDDVTLLVIDDSHCSERHHSFLLYDILQLYKRGHLKLVAKEEGEQA